jgi:hypothetical protein
MGRFPCVASRDVNDFIRNKITSRVHLLIFVQLCYDGFTRFIDSLLLTVKMFSWMLLFTQWLETSNIPLLLWYECRGKSNTLWHPVWRMLLPYITKRSTILISVSSLCYHDLSIRLTCNDAGDTETVACQKLRLCFWPLAPLYSICFPHFEQLAILLYFSLHCRNKAPYRHLYKLWPPLLG